MRIEGKRLSIIVLISGNGSTLQAIIDSIAAQTLSAEIKAVVSEQADAYGLERAEKAGIPTVVVKVRDYPDRNAYDRALDALFQDYQPDLIVLAGFMRILGTDLVKRYYGKLINIHPSLLPRYPGLNTHERALKAGERQHGTTIHFVSEELDGGPIIAQEVVDVLPDDTPDSLKKRVQTVEHQLYPKVLSWFAAGAVQLIPDGVKIIGKLLKNQNDTCKIKRGC